MRVCRVGTDHSLPGHFKAGSTASILFFGQTFHTGRREKDKLALTGAKPSARPGPGCFIDVTALHPPGQIMIPFLRKNKNKNNN